MKTRPARLLMLFALITSSLLSDADAQLFKKKASKSLAPASDPKLAPGQFEWHPERAPAGPLLVVVSVDDQIAYVYRNGVQIARSTVSTGAPGHETPTGVFTILEKNQQHESSIYKGAQMPNMQRLTWSGIAMHAGQLPGYPASHGCVRLPYEFSEKLFSITEKGGTVVVTAKYSKPSMSVKPASILLSSNVDPGSRPAAALVGKTIWDPARSPSGPVNFLISGKDRSIYVYRNGVLIGQSPVGIREPERPIPAGVFLMLEGTEPGVNSVVPGRPIRPWATLSLAQEINANVVEEFRSRLEIPADFARRIYELAHPGTILVTTAGASNSQTSTPTDFTIMRPVDR
ncbi:MAG: L,D-transpeptidase [Verrucomicrobiales bacterium]|nr:L,D-transpeptidase [Verrucomicrobiales bacterium]